MIDTGLLASGIAVLFVAWLTSQSVATGLFERGDVLDRLIMPVAAGLVSGRIVAVVLDDPTSLGSVQAMLVIRSGVEFWPGVAAAGGALAIGLRRSRTPQPIVYAAALVPFLLWGYATYEATCIVRDGCYGPASRVGLLPDGLASRQFPVGVGVGAAIAVLGVILHRSWQVGPWAKIALAVGGVAAVRSVAAIWLPRLGDGLTRQHVQSIVVAATVALGLATVAVVVRLRVRGTQRLLNGTADDLPTQEIRSARRGNA